VIINFLLAIWDKHGAVTPLPSSASTEEAVSHLIAFFVVGVIFLAACLLKGNE